MSKQKVVNANKSMNQREFKGRFNLVKYLENPDLNLFYALIPKSGKPFKIDEIFLKIDKNDDLTSLNGKLTLHPHKKLPDVKKVNEYGDLYDKYGNFIGFLFFNEDLRITDHEYITGQVSNTYWTNEIAYRPILTSNNQWSFEKITYCSWQEYMKKELEATPEEIGSVKSSREYLRKYDPYSFIADRFGKTHPLNYIDYCEEISNLWKNDELRDSGYQWIYADYLKHTFNIDHYKSNPDFPVFCALIPDNYNPVIIQEINNPILFNGDQLILPPINNVYDLDRTSSEGYMFDKDGNLIGFLFFNDDLSISNYTYDENKECPCYFTNGRAFWYIHLIGKTILAEMRYSTWLDYLENNYPELLETIHSTRQYLEKFHEFTEIADTDGSLSELSLEDYNEEISVLWKSEDTDDLFNNNQSTY